MGEFELLARVRERLPPAGPRVRVGMGDDAAVTVPGGATATSVDAIVDGVHFRREPASRARSAARRSPPRSPTWRRWAPSRARPTSSSASRPTSTRTDCIELLDGIAAVAARDRHDPRRRRRHPRPGADARDDRGRPRRGAGAARHPRRRAPGDVLVLTGEIGGAAAGLLLLEQPELPGPALGERRAR